MQYSAEFIILAPPFERNFQITWQKITSWEKWILRIKPIGGVQQTEFHHHRLALILDSPASAPRGQRLLLQPFQKTGTNHRVPNLLILDILCKYANWSRFKSQKVKKVKVSFIVNTSHVQDMWGNRENVSPYPAVNI